MSLEKKLNFLKDKIKEDCGCNTNDCRKCSNEFRKINIYSKTSIPIEYWTLYYKDFKGDQNLKILIENLLQDIDKMYYEGASYAFIGSLGTGKTFSATTILKKAALKNYSAKYYNMDEIIRNSINDNSNSFLKEILSIDFVCIDEYDSRWIFPSEKSEQLFGQTMETILRSRFQNKLPTIICSNTLDIEKVLSGDFSKTTSSLFSKYLKVIYVAGKDFRKIGKK